MRSERAFASDSGLEQVCRFVCLLGGDRRSRAMAPFEQQQLHRISRVVETVKSATRSLENLHEMDTGHRSRPTPGVVSAQRKRVHTMRWRKSGSGWIAVDGHTRCEVNPPRDPNEPIQRYLWSVRTSSNSASGATSSLVESQQAAEQEAAVLNCKEQMK
jgi:hypothetical protein